MSEQKKTCYACINFLRRKAGHSKERNMDEKPERNCYNCKYSSFCFLKRQIEEAITGAWMLNMDTSALRVQLLGTVAKSCTQFKEKEKPV